MQAQTFFPEQQPFSHGCVSMAAVLLGKKDDFEAIYSEPLKII
jgi:hypothetical protein